MREVTVYDEAPALRLSQRKQRLDGFKAYEDALAAQQHFAREEVAEAQLVDEEIARLDDQGLTDIKQRERT